VTVLQIVLAAISAVIALWLVVLIVRDVEPNDYLYAALGLLEVGMIALLVVGLVQVAGDHGDVNVAAYVGYLVGSVVVLPVT